MLAKPGERIKPEAVYGKASRRGAYIVLDLKSPADISELMYALTWGTGGYKSTVARLGTAAMSFISPFLED
jgi:hypothetical protein